MAHLTRIATMPAKISDLAKDLETVLTRNGPREAEQLLDVIQDSYGRLMAATAIDYLNEMCGSDCGALRRDFIDEHQKKFQIEFEVDPPLELRFK
jgi:hypothetical protein